MLLHLTATEVVETLAVEDDRLLVTARWDANHPRPPRHFHPAHDERFEVLSGRVATVIGTSKRVYQAGESFEAPAGTVHSMWPTGGGATATWESRPGQRVLDLFTELDALTRRGLHGPALVMAMGAVVGRHDDVLRLAAHPRPVVRGLLKALSRVV